MARSPLQNAADSSRVDDLFNAEKSAALLGSDSFLHLKLDVVRLKNSEESYHIELDRLFPMATADEQQIKLTDSNTIAVWTNFKRYAELAILTLSGEVLERAQFQDEKIDQMIYESDVFYLRSHTTDLMKTFIHEIEYPSKPEVS